MNNRRKGVRAELEIVQIMKKYGYDCHRAQMMYQKGGIDTADVVGLPGIHIEVKRVENLNVHKAYAQAVADADGKAIPVVFHRRSREEWMVTCSLKDWMEVYEHGKEYFESSL